MAATAVLLAVVVVAILFTAFRFVESERERELQEWQVRLSIVAESRMAAIDAWLGGQRSALADIARNPGVQLLMMTAPGPAEAPASPEIQAQLDSARNLLTVVASRSGYRSEASGPDVPANVERIGVDGIALLTLDADPVVVTRNMPLLDGRLKAFVVGAERGQAAFLDVFAGGTGAPTIAFLEPIFRIQAEPSADAQAGWILGVRTIDQDVYPLLQQPGATERTAETVLVRRDDDQIVFLSPLSAGVEPLTLSLDASTPDLVSAKAIAVPRSFGVGRDYGGRDVLFAGIRSVAQPSWTLVRKVTRDEALSDSDARLDRLLIMMVLGIALIGAAFVGVWYWGASRRAEESARRYKEIAGQLDRRERLLRLVTDNQPHAVFATDAGGHIVFSNGHITLMHGADGPQGAEVGLPVANTVGPAPARTYDRLALRAKADQSAVEERFEIGEGARRRIMRAMALPLPDDSDHPGGTLFVVEDITDLTTAVEKRERTLSQLINTMLDLVDRRDPYSANHSREVAKLSDRIAESMGMDSALRDTARTAGALLNLGKIFVPEEVLTRKGALAPEEMQLIRNSIQSSADIIESIDFDGPVRETLMQVQENVDGTGAPQGLQRDQILMTARIVAVANAYVAMVSPRAHRDGMSSDEAMRALLSDADRKYDLEVVGALVNMVSKDKRSAVV